MANLNPIIGENATVVFNINVEQGNENNNINTVYNNERNRDQQQNENHQQENVFRNRHAYRQREPFYNYRNPLVSTI